MNEEQYGLEEEPLTKITHKMSEEGAGQSSDVQVQVTSHTGKIRRYVYKYNGGKPYKCGVCYKEFSDQASVECHISCHTTEGVKPYICTECGADFDEKTLLEKHKIHADIKLHKCDQCWRSFHTKHGLDVHKRRHLNKPFNCSICNKSFHSIFMLKKHMANKHCNETLYKCGLCSKVFTQHGLLRKHMKVHADSELVEKSGKIYKCDACQKNISDKSNMQALSMDVDNKDLKINFCTDCMSKGINVHQMSNSKYAWK